MWFLGISNIQFPSFSMKFIIKILIMLRLFKKWKHFIIRPAFIAKPRPFIKIQSIPPDISHGIGAATAPKNFSPGNKYPATVHMGLGFSPKCPIHFRSVELRISPWDMDVRFGILSPCFYQQDLVLGIFGKSIGQYATGRTGTNDDKIKLH